MSKKGFTANDIVKKQINVYGGATVNECSLRIKKFQKDKINVEENPFCETAIDSRHSTRDYSKEISLKWIISRDQCFI